MSDYFESELLEIIKTFEPKERNNKLDLFIDCVDESTEEYLKSFPSAGDAFSAALEQHEDYDPTADERTRANALVDEFVLQKLKYKTLN